MLVVETVGTVHVIPIEKDVLVPVVIVGALIEVGTAPAY